MNSDNIIFNFTIINLTWYVNVCFKLIMNTVNFGMTSTTLFWIRSTPKITWRRAQNEERHGENSARGNDTPPTSKKIFDSWHYQFMFECSDLKIIEFRCKNRIWHFQMNNYIFYNFQFCSNFRACMVGAGTRQTPGWPGHK